MKERKENEIFYFVTITGVISKSEKNEQVLDRLQVERERGITVKAQSATLIYKHKGTDYLLNLIDTPVSRICVKLIHVVINP